MCVKSDTVFNDIQYSSRKPLEMIYIYLYLYILGKRRYPVCHLDPKLSTFFFFAWISAAVFSVSYKEDPREKEKRKQN